MAWARELGAVHDRLREALRLVRATAAGPDAAARDLLVYCRGFCAALGGHHAGEDAVLFPAIAADRPDLEPTLRALTQDHAAVADLLAALDDAAERAASPSELERHLDGIGAIMESHFRHEERALAEVLRSLDLDAEPEDVLGGL